ncbi:MAG: ATP phosphoribosyltransferase regulatory subunit [Alphaproteobacteria bacterium]|nr:ATP phosphoribosyltransferase regulatory subunit [Alphaproteobacteria bacterium]
MTPDSPSSAPAASGWADLLASFARAGYRTVAPAILQPVEPFLDLSGEDIRKSLYLTTDPSGTELCLRPDLTIPVARDYLASEQAGEPAAFSYLGPVFRYRGDHQNAEFLQAGIESFARQDRPAADAEMLALALDAVDRLGVRDVTIHTGDVALFSAMLDALHLSAPLRRRLIKDFNRRTATPQDLDRLAAAPSNRDDYGGVLAALAGADREAALALVRDLMSIATTSPAGGRSTGEIAERFLEQSMVKGAALSPAAITALRRFLSIAGTPADTSAQLRALASDCGLDIEAAIVLFENRLALMEKHGINVAASQFSTSFGRGLEYYTGFEFELRHPGHAGPLIAGGRYDALMTQLGSAKAIPAVGFSIWIDALAAVKGSPS